MSAESLRARIEARRARIVANRLPRSESRKRSELARLGAHVSGEPRSVSRRRAALQRALPAAPYEPYADDRPLPPDALQARLELRSMGPYCLGEPGRLSRRRAAIEAALPSLPERKPSSGFKRDAIVVPGDSVSIQAALAALGPYVRGEPVRVSRLRAALNRALAEIDGPGPLPDPGWMTAESILIELDRLGVYCLGERNWISRRRAALVRECGALGLANPYAHAMAVHER